MKSTGRGGGTVLIATLTLAAVALSSVGCGIIRPTRGRRGDATQGVRPKA